MSSSFGRDQSGHSNILHDRGLQRMAWCQVLQSIEGAIMQPEESQVILAKLQFQHMKHGLRALYLDKKFRGEFERFEQEEERKNKGAGASGNSLVSRLAGTPAPKRPDLLLQDSRPPSPDFCPTNWKTSPMRAPSNPWALTASP